jgi:hypothetical protein
MKYLEQSELKTDVVYLCQTYTGNLMFVAYHDGGNGRYEDMENSDSAYLPSDGYVRYVWDLEDVPEEIISKLTEKQKMYRNFILGWRKKSNF